MAVSKPKRTINKKDYELAISSLHKELVHMQEWVKNKGLKVVIIFEGRDASGKGGTIKRFTEPLNPRVCKVVALGCQPSGKKRSGIFNVMFLFCLQPERLFY